VTSKEQKEGKLGTCEHGGSEFSSASGKTYACNGQTGFTSTLPKGDTETGAWALQSSKVTESPETVFTAISFSIPLLVSFDEQHALFVEPGSSAHEAECPGSAANPKATPGNLCVYAQKVTKLSLIAVGPAAGELGEGGASTSGALILMSTTPGEEGFAYGTWAVTAP
jgi:hypothetical protein